MYAAAIAAAAASAPQGSVPITPGRILLADGDGLAYYCAGNDDTDAGEARQRVVDKLKTAAKAVGAERIIVLITGSGSHKGHRYAVAQVKPYQGQRAGSRRPKNWEALREFITGPDLPFEKDVTLEAEADDLFGWYAYTQPSNVVIYTHDKDMRMLPGIHLDWVSHRVHTVSYSSAMDGPVEVLDSVFNEKQYGPKWFWLQMLHGDTADNIPGLPRYVVDGKAKPVGEVTAGKLLDSEHLLHLRVAELYRSYYGDRWLVEMLEQAVLLWLRRVPDQWDDCTNPGGPLASFNDGEKEFAAAYFEIEKRIKDAKEINDQAKDN